MQPTVLSVSFKYTETRKERCWKGQLLIWGFCYLYYFLLYILLSIHATLLVLSRMLYQFYSAGSSGFKLWLVGIRHFAILILIFARIIFFSLFLLNARTSLSRWRLAVVIMTMAMPFFASPFRLNSNWVLNTLPPSTFVETRACSEDCFFMDFYGITDYISSLWLLFLSLIKPPI